MGEGDGVASELSADREEGWRRAKGLEKTSVPGTEDVDVGSSEPDKGVGVGPGDGR